MVQSEKSRKKPPKFRKKFARFLPKIRKIFAKIRNILPTCCRNFQTLRGPFSAVSRRLTKLKTIEGVPRRGLADGAKQKKSKNLPKFANSLQTFCKHSAKMFKLCENLQSTCDNLRTSCENDFSIRTKHKIVRKFAENCSKRQSRTSSKGATEVDDGGRHGLDDAAK